MPLSLIGAGFGRTGTMSLKHAIEALGVGRCYHMMEVAQNPRHAREWDRVADGSRDRWDDLFDGYAATVDWPACRYWRELSEHYPEARVLLTVRDPEAWYESVSQTLLPIMQTGQMPGASEPNVVLAMARKTVLQRTFDDRFEDRDHALAVFERHNQAVRGAFDSDRLLVYEAGDGWEPLCEFLGLDVPDDPFPHLNTRDALRTAAGL